MFWVDDFSVGVPAVNIAVLGASYTLNKDFRLTRMEISATLRNATAGEGPLAFGLATADLTVGEIAECLLAQPPDPSDTVAMERAKRPVWLLGIFNDTGGSFRQLNNGSVTVWTKRWTFSAEGEFAPFVFYLDSVNTPMTTGSVVAFVAKLHGVWLT